MIMCGGRTEEDGWVNRISDDRRGGWVGFDKCM